MLTIILSPVQQLLADIVITRIEGVTLGVTVIEGVMVGVIVIDGVTELVGVGVRLHAVPGFSD